MASVLPVATFTDDAAGWLDHLARVTRWTVGARCAAAGLVVLGTFDATSSTLAVDEVLLGSEEPGILELDRPAGAGAPVPVLQDGERALVFLADDGGRWRPLDAPGAVVPAGPDVDVARWYAALPTEPGPRTDALVAVARDQDSPGRTSALRAIGDDRLDAAAPALVDLAPTADPTTATLAAVALWLLGRQDAAVAAFDAVVDRVGRDAFLALWDVQRTTGDESTLYGPDPDGWRST